MNSKDEKIAAFVKRYVKTTSPQDIDEACERNFRKLMATVEAMKEAEAKARKEAREELKPLEQLILTAVQLLHNRGTASAILRKTNELSGERNNFGSVYVTIVRLEERRFIKTWFEGPSKPDGRQTRYVALTAYGERALANARQRREASIGFVRRPT